MAKEIVKVARNLARGPQPDGGFEARDFRRFLWKEDGLQIEGGAQVFLHQPFTFADLLVKSGILDGDRDGWREQAHGARMIFSEEAHPFTFQIHDASHHILQHEGGRELAAYPGIGRDVARINGGIVYPYNLASRGGGARDAFPDRDAFDAHALVIAQAEAMAKFSARRIHQQNAESAVIDQGPNAGRDLAQQYVQIETGREFVRNARERPDGAVLALGAAVEQGILDGHGGAATNQTQKRAVVVGIGAQLSGLDVNDADEPLPRNHRNAELAANGVRSRQITRIGANVRNENR